MSFVCAYIRQREASPRIPKVIGKCVLDTNLRWSGARRQTFSQKSSASMVLKEFHSWLFRSTYLPKAVTIPCLWVLAYLESTPNACINLARHNVRFFFIRFRLRECLSFTRQDQRDGNSLQGRRKATLRGRILTMLRV